MDLFDSAVTRYALIVLSVLFGAALLYFVFIGVRALFREARSIARGAGHTQGSAAVRALVRMTVWAVFFGLFYLLAFTLGKRLGWWAVPLVLAALAAMIWCLLLADRLLTVVPGDVRQQAGIAVTLLGMLGLFAAGVLLAIRS
jgi:hypothetical protein